jgi:hypothetical protein
VGLHSLLFNIENEKMPLAKKLPLIGCIFQFKGPSREFKGWGKWYQLICLLSL